MLRGQLDAAPFVMVFFLILIFVLLGTLTFTPGLQVQLPMAADMPGTKNPSVNVTVDPQGRLYFENQLVDETEFGQRLRQAIASTPPPLTLVIRADQAVTYDTLLHVTQLARKAGVQEAILATMPRLFQGEPPTVRVPQ